MTNAHLVCKVKTEAEMMQLAACLAQQLEAGDVIGLSGDLGAGKTVLARGIIQALRPEETDVPSPTFSLVQSYETDAAIIWHFDLYRLENPSEIWELGYEEALEGGLCLIEWPGRASALIPQNALHVEIELLADAVRQVTFSTDRAYISGWAQKITTMHKRYQDKIGN